MQFITLVYVLDNYHKELLDIVEFSFGTYKIISCHLKPLKKIQFHVICNYIQISLNIKSYPYFFEGSNGESKRSMATEKKLSDVEIESDDDYELDEIEEHELEVRLYLAQIIQYSFPILISFLILYFFTT